MLRSHILAFCGWVNMKLYELDMYIENDIHIYPSTEGQIMRSQHPAPHLNIS